MSELIANNPEYRAVKVMRVNWDTYRRDDIVRELRIPRRSTLVMFKDGKEVGRVIAQTQPEDIEVLFIATL
ncbi:MAG: thioredoxin family protein [Gammaproteobacteria bacterium]